MENDKKIADQLKVSVAYKNKSMDTVCEREYEFAEYTALLCLDVRRIILDVEDLIYQLQDGKQKGEWADSAVIGFNRIRHKLLDRAGEISRLGQNIHLQENEDRPRETALVNAEPDDGIMSFMSKIFGT